MATYSLPLQIRLPTEAVHILITMVVEVAPGKVREYYTAIINTNNSADDFNVKLSHAHIGTLTVGVLAVGICDT